MSGFQKFQGFAAALLSGQHDFLSDDVRAVLVAGTPSPGDAVLSDLGLPSPTLDEPMQLSLVDSSGTARLVPDNVVFSVSGGPPAGPFRHVAVYNASSGAGNLIGWFTYDEDVLLEGTDQFTVAFDSSDGILSLT